MELTINTENYFSINFFVKLFKRLFYYLSSIILKISHSQNKIPKTISKNKMPGGITAKEVKEILNNLEIYNINVIEVDKDVVCLDNL